MASPPVREGTVSFRGHPVWYRIVGDPAAPLAPVLCLHGGPGAPHDYLQPYEELAADGRQVVFYDQLGCGNSAIAEAHDPDMWEVALFVEEVGAVRTALGLDSVHLLGQSWGGMLAMEYALTRPSGVRSLIVEGSPASMPQWVAEANRLRAELPKEVEATLRHHEQAGTTTSPEYEEAMMVFYRHHVCRVDPWPDYLLKTFAKLQTNPEVYNTMNGPSEFHVVGKLKTWDITSRLGEISTPTLVMSGRYDEATPAIAETVHRGIPASEWVLFEDSSHMCHIEERKRCLDTVRRFVARYE